jgi:hypothetical protein
MPCQLKLLAGIEKQLRRLPTSHTEVTYKDIRALLKRARRVLGSANIQ